MNRGKVTLITPETKVRVLLKEYPEMEAVLTELATAFKKHISLSFTERQEKLPLLSSLMLENNRKYNPLVFYDLPCRTIL